MKMSNGLCVLHLFGNSGPHMVPVAATAALESAERADVQVVTARLLGHKAQWCVMLLGVDTDPMFAVQSALRAAGAEIVDSYLSITEVSEYAPNLPDKMLQDRLFPKLPPADKPAFCFYPMSKGRAAHANWYAEPFDRRRDMMYEHGTSGRAFAGKIVQLITASTGLDAYEWGVTLFGTGLEVIKDVVYTLRFDEASAQYGIFGDFWVGEVVESPEQLFR